MPTPASRIRRIFGWLIDYLIVMVPAAGLVTLALSSLVGGLPGFLGSVAADAGWARLVSLFTNRGGSGIGAAFASGWMGFVAPLLLVLLLVPFVQFVYETTFLLWRGRTIGMMVTDAKVAASDPQAVRLGAGRAMRRSFVTTAADSGVLSIAMVVVVAGEFLVGMFLWVVAVLVFWANALPALGSGRRTFADRFAGCVVLRRRLLADLTQRAAVMSRQTAAIAEQAARATRQAALTSVAEAPAKTQRAIEATQRTAEIARTTAVTASRAATDAAVVAGQLAREGMDAVARTAPVQQAINSRAVQAVQAAGGRTASKAKALWRARREPKAD